MQRRLRRHACISIILSFQLVWPCAARLHSGWTAGWKRLAHASRWLHTCWYHFAQMVLDNRVYDGLEGPWRDLFQRLKWDIVKSVLKSMTGLQGRKVKVCHLYPGQPAHHTM